MRRLDMVFLHPGQVHVDAHPGCVSTVCGPGVVACLWDGANRWGGIFHYLVGAVPGRAQATPQLGSVGLARTLRLLRELGSDVRELRAKVFGGATAPNGTVDLRAIAAGNVAFIHDSLAALHIPVQREDVGGQRGRKIVYYTESNRVKVLRAERIRDRDWCAPLDVLRRMRT